MRTLYLPNVRRRSARTKQLLDRIVQDNVRTDEHSRQHAIVNALVVELERAHALVTRLDPRPWAADTRAAGTLEEARPGLPEVPFTEMLYDIPARWAAVRVKSYPYAYSASVGMLGGDGAVLAPGDVDRVVEHRSGLVVQSGRLLYRLTEENPYGERLEELPEEGCLVSLTEDAYDVLPGEEPATTEVDVRLAGLALHVGGPGLYQIRVSYQRTAPVTSGTDTGTLEDFAEAGKLVDGEGREVLYAIDPATGVLTVPGDTGTGPGGEGQTYRLFYQAEHVFTHRTATLPVGVLRREAPGEVLSVDLGPVAESMYRLPGPRDITGYAVTDTLAFIGVPGGSAAVDRAGFVGEVNVGHAISCVLPSEYHAVVAGGRYVTLVDTASELIPLRLEFPGGLIKGVSWLESGEIGIIVAAPGGFDVYALRDVPEVQSGGFMAMSLAAPAARLMAGPGEGADVVFLTPAFLVEDAP